MKFKMAPNRLRKKKQKQTDRRDQLRLHAGFAYLVEYLQLLEYCQQLAPLHIYANEKFSLRRNTLAKGLPKRQS